MRILLVSWEYPPVVVGGLGRHVHHLASGLATAGHEVVVLSRQPTGTDPATAPSTDSTGPDGVRVIAAAEDPLALRFGEDMMPWVLSMGHSMLRTALGALGGGGTGSWVPDVVHAHDWLAAHAAISLAEFFDGPLVSTIHATEAGRHSGWISHPINRQVHSVEWWLANESDALICCSTSMLDEVTRLFTPSAPLTLIPNGIDAPLWPRRTAAPTGPPEVLFVGRLEYEKGVQDLFAAAARLKKNHPNLRVTVAGTGTQTEWLTEVARKYRVTRMVNFVGAQHRDELVELLHRATVLVIPSRYEPFGIVALEGAATGTPLISTEVGGLGDFVVDGTTGLTVPPGSPAAIAAAIEKVVDDPDSAQERTAAAAVAVGEYTWERVVAETIEVYSAVRRRPRGGLARPVIAQRPLPERDLP